MKQLKKDYGTINAYYCEDFYELFTEKEKEEVDLKLFRKIVRKYVEIYIRDLYDKFNQTTYFPFSGTVKLTKAFYKGRYIIKWLWMNRPGMLSVRYINLSKVGRGNGFIFSAEKVFKQKNDILELPNDRSEFVKKHKLNQIYFDDKYIDPI